MSFKVKLISCIVAFCMILSILVVGVFSLKSTNFDVNGSISFEANGAKATISQGELSTFDSTLNGGKQQSDFFKSFKITTSMYQEDVEEAAASWSGVKLKFPDNGDPVTLSFSVTNDNKNEQLVVWPECITDTTNSNVSIDIKGEETINNVLAKSGTAGEDVENYTITFSLFDKKISVIDFEFTIKVKLTTASELPQSSIYEDKLSFFTTHYDTDLSTDVPMPANCLSVKQASDKVSGNIEFPDFVLFNSAAYKVSEIGYQAFSGDSPTKANTNIKRLTFSKTITSIGNFAFCYCSGLTGDLNLQNVTSIGRSAFSGCSGLASLNLQNVTSIGDYAFRSCSNLAGELNLPKVTSIGKYAFEGNGVFTTITLSSELISIGSSAFLRCGGITYPVAYLGTLEQWLQIDFENTSSNPTYHSKKLKINGQIITELKLNCETVGNNAFYNCKDITSLTLGENVTSIGNAAFSNCSGLTGGLDLQNITSIGSSAFYGCSGLTSVTFGSSLTKIDNYAFFNCSNLAGNLNLQNVTSIGNSAFQNCSGLTGDLNLQNVTSIGNYAFQNCSGLTGVNLQNVTRVSERAFDGCSNLTGKLNLQNVTSIGSSAFNGCSGLTSVVIPESITDASKIKTNAFSGCSKLTSVTIDSASVAAALTDQTSCGNLIEHADTVRIKDVDGLTVGSYVTENYNEPTKDGDYWVYTIK